MPNDTGPPISTAQPPFDDANADIVLRTSDHVDFHVFRVILALSSPFFRDMFSLPQPSKPPTCTNKIKHSQSKVNEVPVPTNPSIDVPEDSLTLDTLLRFLYPNTHVSSFHDLLHARNVAVAASKYDMSTALGLIANGVQINYIKSHPLEVYFVACRMGWGDVAKAAAECCLDPDVTESSKIIQSGLLDYPGAAVAYHKLEEYRNNCCKAAREKLWNLDLFKEPRPFSCKDDENQSGQCWAAWATEYMTGILLITSACPTKEALDDVSLIPDACCSNCNVSVAPLIAKVRPQVTSLIQAVLSEVELGFGS